MKNELRALDAIIGTGNPPRVEFLHGRRHLVVPVIALMEGVIHAVNAPTREFVPAARLAAAAGSWNGRPLVIGHPTENGRQISANRPDVIARQGFGVIYESRMAGNRLGQEAWIDPERLIALGQRNMLADIEAGKPIEVSVGAFVKTLEKSGTHGGKDYQFEWGDITGDHLAFLPGGRGACSLEMGCGACRAASSWDDDDFRALWPDKSGKDDHGRDGLSGDVKEWYESYVGEKPPMAPGEHYITFNGYAKSWDVRDNDGNFVSVGKQGRTKEQAVALARDFNQGKTSFEPFPSSTELTAFKQAHRDAIETTAMRIREEKSAMAMTTPGGFDHETAKKELAHYEEVQAKQVARARKEVADRIHDTKGKARADARKKHGERMSKLYSRLPRGLAALVETVEAEMRALWPDRHGRDEHGRKEGESVRVGDKHWNKANHGQRGTVYSTARSEDDDSLTHYVKFKKGGGEFVKAKDLDDDMEDDDRNPNPPDDDANHGEGKKTQAELDAIIAKHREQQTRGKGEESEWLKRYVRPGTNASKKEVQRQQMAKLHSSNALRRKLELEHAEREKSRNAEEAFLTDFRVAEFFWDEELATDEEIVDFEELKAAAIALKMTDCPACGGAGNYSGNPCEACDGSGKVPKKPRAAETADEEAEMALTKEKKAATIAALTACTCSGFAKGDEVILAGLSDEKLEALAAKADENRGIAGQLKAAQESLKTLEAKTPQTEAELLAAHPRIKALVDAAEATTNAERDTLVGSLKAATAGAFTEEELKAKDVPELRKLASALKVATEAVPAPSFAGRATVRVAADKVSAYDPPNAYAESIKALQAAK